MSDDSVVVANYLLTGLTERDLHEITKQLKNYGKIFIEDPDLPPPYHIEMISDTVYPVIALKVDAAVWERFAGSHDMEECSLLLAQEGILGEVH